MDDLKPCARYSRDYLRYASDMTDAECEVIELVIPPTKRGGCKRDLDVREVVNRIMYILSTGRQWRAIPRGIPSRNAIYDTLIYGSGMAH